MKQYDLFDDGSTRKLNLHWGAIESALSNINAQYNQFIKGSKKEPISIATISRGGFIGGTILSHSLDLPIVMNFHSMTYNKENKKNARATIFPSIIVPNVKQILPILVVDDIIDSGDTMDAIFQMYPVQEIIFASITSKQPKEKIPEQYRDRVIIGSIVPNDVWVEFPWEIIK